MLDQETIKDLIATLPAILDIRDAAQLLRVNVRTIRKEIREDNLSAYQADGEWNILRADFIAYLWKNANL